MAVVVYQCDTCNRKIETSQNKLGLEVIDRCIITYGCRGSLEKIKFSPLKTRPEFPVDVTDLINHTPRKILYNHEQTFLSDEWDVVHDLGAHPSVQIFIEQIIDGKISLVETDADNIEIISKNRLKIYLPSTYQGIAQCVGRSAAGIEPVVEVAARTFSTISPNNEISIATFRTGDIFRLELQFVDPVSGSLLQTLLVPFGQVTTINSPWRQVKRLLIDGRVYSARSANLGTILANANIESGTAFYISRYFHSNVSNPPPDAGYLNFNRRDVYMLMSNSPYTSVDVIKTKTKDLYEWSTPTQGIQTSFIENNQLFIYDDKLTSIFPPITVTVAK